MMTVTVNRGYLGHGGYLGRWIGLSKIEKPHSQTQRRK